MITRRSRSRICFQSSQGCYGTFGFIDPLANLLGWTEDLLRPDWQTGLMSVTRGVNDPQGQQRAWAVINATPGEQQLIQTLGIPGSYVTCFSAWVRSDATGQISLKRDDTRMTGAIGPQWRRIFIGGTGTDGASSSSFSIAVTPGQSVQTFGLQVEVQPYPSQYKPSTAATGIYEETYFAADELTMTNTGPGFSACELKLDFTGLKREQC